MSKGEDITTRFKVDISDLKKGIKDANKNIQLATAEFKAASAGMDDWSKSSDGIKAKLKQLSTELVEQNSKLENYKKQQEAVENAYKENGKRADELKLKLNQLANQGVSKVSDEYKSYQKALSEVEKEQINNKKASDDLKIAILNQQGTVNKTKKEIDKYEDSLKDVEAAEKLSAKSGKSVEDSLKKISNEAENTENILDSFAKNLTGGLVKGLGGIATAAAGVVTAFLATGEASQDTIEDMGKLETAFKTAGHTSEQAKKSYKQMVGILGETDQSVEAVNHLAKLTQSEQELADWTNIAAGVYGTFGDSLPIEGLTEAANETAKVGQLTGPLTDAINWAAEAGETFGVTLKKNTKANKEWNDAVKNATSAEDYFNLALQNCTTEQERATFITDTLNKLYSEAGENYREVNGELILAREAQAELSTATSEMGRIAAPIVSELKYGFADILTAITDMIKGIDSEEIAKKIKDGFQYFIDEVLPKIKDGLQWLMDNKDIIISAIAGIVATMVVSQVATFAVEMVKVAKNIAKVAKAQGLWNAVMTANPIGLIALGVGLLVSAIVLLIQNWDTVKEVAIKVWDKIKEAWGKAGEWFSSNVVEPVKKFFSDLEAKISESFENAKNAISNVWGTVTEWFSTNIIEPIKTFFSELGNNISEFFSDAWDNIVLVWTTVSEWFSTNVIEPIKNFFSPLVEWFTQLFTSIWSFIESVFLVIVGLAEGTVESIKLVWGVVSEWFNENIIKPVTKFFSDLWQSIKDAAQIAWDFIVSVWEAVSNWFDENIIQPVGKFFTNLWDGIKNAASNAWDGIKEIWKVVSNWFDNNIIQPVQKIFDNIWGNLKSGASDAWQGIKDVFSKVASFFKDTFEKAWSKVKDIFSTGGQIFDGIKDGIVSSFKNIVNAIIRGINKVISVPFNGINDALKKLKNISIIGQKPFSNLPTISVPQIPELEWGGYAKKGHQYLLEGKGDEYVVPLHKNKYWIGKVADELKKQLALANVGATNNLGSSISNSNVNNYTQNIYAPKQPSRIELYRETRRLLALKGGY